MSLTSITSPVNAVGASLSGLSNSTSQLFNDLTGKNTSWRAQLKQASFRGVKFGVFDSQIRFGRKSSVHEYPFRGSVWVEDMGRAARRISFSAFLVGDDCIQQRNKLIEACEAKAAVEGGELVHPSLGNLTVSLAAEVVCIERWDRGRVFEIGFSFIEQGARQFPSSQLSTGDAVGDALTVVSTAGQLSFLQKVAGALQTGISAAQQVQATIQGWGSSALHLVHDATSLMNSVQSLSGNFGRLFGQGTIRSSSTTVSVQTLIAQGAVARTTVQQAVTAMSAGAAGLLSASGPTVDSATSTTALQAFAASVLALPSTMASVASTPADGIRLVGNLIASVPEVDNTGPNVPTASPGVALTAAQAVTALSTASASLLRRAGVTALAQLSSQYQPVSRDDAQSVLDVVLAAIDAEITIAGDAGEDDVYNGLRAMRTAVVEDLNTRAASAPSLMTVSMAASLPASVLAQRLYQDATRADELVQEANPIHPAFMPVSFQALAR